MENETRRGYDLPLTENKFLAWLFLALTGFASYQLWGDMVKSGFDPATCLICGAGMFIMLYISVLEMGRSFAKLHIVPEGIAITLFGKTLRQFHRHQIVHLAGFSYRKKQTVYKYLAVCGCSMKELAEEMHRRTSRMFRDSPTLPGWTENMARTFLQRYANSVRHLMGFSRKDTLLIEWSPERLELLEDMYPGVPWTDLTEGKSLDAERNT